MMRRWDPNMKINNITYAKKEKRNGQGYIIA